MKKGSVLWTIRYTILNAAYFAAFCALHAYAAVYLLACGFNNTEVGILLAVANVLSAVLQPVVAGTIDGGGFFTNRRFIMFSEAVILVGALVLLYIPGNKVMIFVIFALIYMIQFVYQPVLTALCFEYQKRGCDIFYGLARGLGSAGYAVTSFFIGKAVSDRGVSVLLWVTIAMMAVSFLFTYTFQVSGKEKTVTEDKKPEGKAHNSLSSFAAVYPAFMLFLVGTICFFFAHNMINDFMIVIIRNLGGDETQMGYATSLQAILELPMMASIGIILKKFSADKLLIFSGVAFLVKILILVFAQGMGHMYLSQFFQLFAYAVFIPAGAYYVSTTMEEFDQVKGQAFITSAITVGGVFSSLVSGIILDHLGIGPMLIVGSVVCAVGVVVTYVGFTRFPHYKKV